MRLTQKEQIKNAKRAYLFQLSDGNSVSRYAIYLDDGNGLKILWPSDSHEGKKSTQLLPSPVFSNSQKYPAYHFILKGYGYSKPNDIKIELRAINPAIEVFTMEGSEVSNV